MSLQKNSLEQVKDDAVRTARAGDNRLSSIGANFPASASSAAFGENITRPGANGQTIGPFIVDESPLDDPDSFIM